MKTKTNKGSAIVLVTMLAFIVLGLGALVGWQWHRSQMENLLLDNLKLQQELDILQQEEGSCSAKEENKKATASAEFLENTKETSDSAKTTANNSISSPSADFLGE